MSTDYKLKACSDYCPLDSGEEDMCMGMAKECYRKIGSSDMIEVSPQNRVQDILQKIIKAQEQKKQSVVL